MRNFSLNFSSCLLGYSSREEHRSKALEFLKAGKRTLAVEHAAKCADVTPEMAYELIKALRENGIQYIVAPFEVFLSFKSYYDMLLQPIILILLQVLLILLLLLLLFPQQQLFLFPLLLLLLLLLPLPLPLMKMILHLDNRLS